MINIEKIGISGTLEEILRVMIIETYKHKNYDLMVGYIEKYRQLTNSEGKE